jgi:hypothetical protein
MPKISRKFVETGKMNGYVAATTSDSEEAKSDAEENVFNIRAAC